MNTSKIKWMVAVLMEIIGLVVNCFVFTPSSQPVGPIEPDVAKGILHNTVQIRLFAPLRECEQSGCGSQGYVMAQGLGSVVIWQGATLIVTHNHWGEMLADAEYIRILDAQGNQLRELGMEEFSNLILYRDPGTLVFAAPAGLPAAASLDKHIQVQIGDVVTLVHQAADDPDRVELLQARVVRNKNYKGQPVFKLALAGEGQIIPGDSGGGIWLNGALVGNMWSSYINTIKFPFSAEISLAAPLPSGYLQYTESARADSHLQTSSLFK